MRREGEERRGGEKVRREGEEGRGKEGGKEGWEEESEEGSLYEFNG